jgi:NADH-quinone oxidoreductase subunit F
MPVGHHVAVIGGGNAAIDSARTAVRLGATATVIYRRERKDMPAIEEEVEAAEQEGVRFQFLAAPHRIVGDHGEVKGVEVVKTRLGEFDPSGRRRPILTDEVRMIRCSSVILAVGEAVDRDFCAASGLSVKESGVLDVNRYTLETSREKFYAGGDLVTGASNISNAMGYGKEAARHIDARLSGEARFDAILPRFDYDQRLPDSDPCRRHRGRDLPASARRKTFAEATEGLSAEEAAREAARCLRCDIRENGVHAAALP